MVAGCIASCSFDDQGSKEHLETPLRNAECGVSCRESVRLLGNYKSDVCQERASADDAECHALGCEETRICSGQEQLDVCKLDVCEELGEHSEPFQSQAEYAGEMSVVQIKNDSVNSCTPGIGCLLVEHASDPAICAVDMKTSDTLTQWVAGGLIAFAFVEGDLGGHAEEDCVRAGSATEDTHPETNEPGTVVQDEENRTEIVSNESAG
ncbi:hypothetical protein PF010_g13097 [Phytophthora fragariae]|nr:hypothetical protein PF011_g12101 [Phytophthora fragariae]KAE9105230.1 hypothetical protein PF010_g13097 [Phytophthora fragariae]KAE9138310.1 hypothetical protein PF006_g13977 [Phytophthora fragariae]